MKRLHLSLLSVFCELKLKIFNSSWFWDLSNRKVEEKFWKLAVKNCYKILFSVLYQEKFCILFCRVWKCILRGWVIKEILIETPWRCQLAVKICRIINNENSVNSSKEICQKKNNLAAFDLFSSLIIIIWNLYFLCSTSNAQLPPSNIDW